MATKHYGVPVQKRPNLIDGLNELRGFFPEPKGIDSLIRIVRQIRKEELDRLEYRDYQSNVMLQLLDALDSGSGAMVVMPPRYGKTLIAVVASIYANQGGGKAIIMAPYRTLIAQHKSTLDRMLDGGVVMLTGGQDPEKRKLAYENSNIVIATPQTIFNDMRNGRISVGKNDVLIFDECHMNTGEYAYARICRMTDARIIGLTGSPGISYSAVMGIKERMRAVPIVRTGNEHDTHGYSPRRETRVNTIMADNRVEEVARQIRRIIYEELRRLSDSGIISAVPLLWSAHVRLGYEWPPPHFNRNSKIQPSQEISFYGVPEKELRRIDAEVRSKDDRTLAVSYGRLGHAAVCYNMIETGDFSAFLSYIANRRAEKEKSASLYSFLGDERLNSAANTANSYLSRNVDHPKVNAVCEMLKGMEGKKVMVFTPYIATAELLAMRINCMGIPAGVLTGKGSRLAQRKTVNAFNDGTYRVLVGTVGDVGLDTDADVEINYRPESALRQTQREGRVGRTKNGISITLCYSGSADDIRLKISGYERRSMMNSTDMLRRESRQTRPTSIQIRRKPEMPKQLSLEFAENMHRDDN